MPRINSLVETGVLTADTQLTTVKTYVFSVEVAWQNGAVGENVWLRDTDDGTIAQTNIEVPIIFSTANGVVQLSWAQGKEFATGLYVDKGATTGQILVTVQYKT